VGEDELLRGPDRAELNEVGPGDGGIICGCSDVMLYGTTCVGSVVELDGACVIVG